MIDKRTLEIILAEQVQELAIKAQSVRCRRKEEALVKLDSAMAQVVIGVRRSGKSTLCFNVLHDATIKYAYVNFDDERLFQLKASELNNVLEVLYKINGEFTHLFLDEIQNVKGWHLFVNRMLRQGMKVIITGSNAKLLSSELATHLTGRHHSIELFPFSFGEYCAYRGLDEKTLTTKVETQRRAAFDEYLLQGGFPELLLGEGDKQYVSNLVDDIVRRDIQQRYKIRYFAAFERMVRHLMNIAPTILNAVDLTKTFGFGTPQTTNHYIKYLKQAYLLVVLSKYSAKSRLRITEEKLYTVDAALMDKRPDAFVGENLGWRLETIVFLELCLRVKTSGCWANSCFRHAVHGLLPVDVVGEPVAQGAFYAHFLGDAGLLGVYIVDVGVTHAHGNVGIGKAATQQPHDVELVVGEVGVLPAQSCDDAVVLGIDEVAQVAPQAFGQTAVLDFEPELVKKFLWPVTVFIGQVDD